MKPSKPEAQPKKVAQEKKSTDARPSVDFGKPMSLGDFEKAFNGTASPLN